MLTSAPPNGGLAPDCSVGGLVVRLTIFRPASGQPHAFTGRGCLKGDERPQSEFSINGPPQARTVGHPRRKAGKIGFNTNDQPLYVETKTGRGAKRIGIDRALTLMRSGPEALRLLTRCRPPEPLKVIHA